eukprot:9300797-Pyramimonas_sp.AAC.1
MAKMWAAGAMARGWFAVGLGCSLKLAICGGTAPTLGLTRAWGVRLRGLASKWLLARAISSWCPPQCGFGWYPD